MTALYAVWREVNGHQSEYDPGPMEKKQAVKVATYQTSISIYRYFIKEVSFTADADQTIDESKAKRAKGGKVPVPESHMLAPKLDWAQCVTCTHMWQPEDISEHCPACNGERWRSIQEPAAVLLRVQEKRERKERAFLAIDMQSRPDPEDARSMPDPDVIISPSDARFDEVWAHCRECEYEWQPKSEDEDCPSCGDKDWDVIDPPAALEAAHTADAEAQGDRLVFRPGVSSSRIGPVETRRAAHETAQEDPRSNRERVVSLLKKAGGGGLTCDEIEVADGMQFTTAGAIIIDLRTEGWVVQSRSEPTRLTRRGSRACVWVHLETQVPEGARNVAKMGKGKWKEACEQAYAMMQADGWEDAEGVLAIALGKEEWDKEGTK